MQFAAGFVDAADDVSDLDDVETITISVRGKNAGRIRNFVARVCREGNTFVQ